MTNEIYQFNSNDVRRVYIEWYLKSCEKYNEQPVSYNRFTELMEATPEQFNFLLNNVNEGKQP